MCILLDEFVRWRPCRCPAFLVVLLLGVVAFGGDAENFKSLARVLLRSSTSQGVSILQGPHQVAQKLMSTALPCSWRARPSCR